MDVGGECRRVIAMCVCLYRERGGGLHAAIMAQLSSSSTAVMDAQFKSSRVTSSSPCTYFRVPQHSRIVVQTSRKRVGGIVQKAGWSKTTAAIELHSGVANTCRSNARVDATKFPSRRPGQL
jgi:hypothetical protein